MIPRGFSAEKGWRCELGELLACSTEAAKRCWLFHGLWDRESRSRHRRLHPPCLRAPWGARLAPPARRLTGAAPRTQDGGARVPGLGGPLGQRAVAAEEAAPARPPHPAAGAGRPGGEPQGDGGRWVPGGGAGKRGVPEPRPWQLAPLPQPGKGKGRVVSGRAQVPAGERPVLWEALL